MCAKDSIPLQGATVQAREYVNEGLALDCNHRLLHIQRGHLLLRNGDVGDAIEDFSIALGRPVHMAAYEGLLLAYTEQTRHKKVGSSHNKDPPKAQNCSVALSLPLLFF